MANPNMNSQISQRLIKYWNDLNDAAKNAAFRQLMYEIYTELEHYEVDK